MKIEIGNDSNQPLYKQIYNQLRLKIIKGELKQGDLLPSIRELSKTLNLSVITIKRAYSELEHNKYITTHQGKGCYVSTIDLEKEFMNNKLNAEKRLKRVISESKLLGLNNDDIKSIFEKLLANKTNKEKQVAS